MLAECCRRGASRAAASPPCDNRLRVRLTRHTETGPNVVGRGRVQRPQTLGRDQRKDCMFYRSALALSVVMALVTACGPAAVSSVSVESSGLAASSLGGAAQAVSAQATPP